MPKITVEWETDGETVDLPSEVDVPEHVCKNELEWDGSITDWLSDTYGWLVLDWRPIDATV